VIGRLLGRSPERRPPSPELQKELDADPAWMYPWRFGDARPPLLNEELPSVHKTRAQMIEPLVRAALKRAGRGATALDIACSEGWFSQRLLDWGADRVVGVDVREVNVRRAALVRDQLGIDGDRLRFVRSDLFDLDPDRVGRFDVVLMLGLVYHLENPVGGVRIARRLTRSLCLIESQLTRQDEPITHGWGVTGVTLPAEPSFAGMVEEDFDRNPIASSGSLMSFIPNRAALREMALVAGFEQVEFLAAGPDLNRQYAEGDRAIVAVR
jgi:tRNA (mo5U34)-methyltransferase